jgi:small-conductance mechanosensitive channel
MVIIKAFLPTLATALMLLIIGWLTARMIRAIVLRIGGAISRVLERTGITQHLHFVRLPWPLAVICANVLYWVVLIIFIAAAASLLRLPGVAVWVDQAIAILPKVFAAALIVLFGYVVAAFIREFISGTTGQTGRANSLGQGFFVTVLAVAAVVAADELGVDVGLLQTIIAIAVAAMFGGIAFAFGLGAGSSVDNIIAGYYLRKTYRVGQRVKVGDCDGVILEISPTAVMIDTRAGRAQVPARLFNTQVSVLLEEDVNHGE